MLKLKELRENRGMQQKELAVDLGYSQPTISDWESGRKVPSSKSTSKIADYFDVSVDYLLGRTVPLIIPDILQGAQVAFHRGEFEDLQQDEIDRLAEYAAFMKSQRNK